MDVLGFKQFKNFYGDVLAKRAREGLGILSKADFLVAIAEPFQLTFTPERIKKSFELVGLHPYNPDAITPAMMATSRATSSHAPIHTNVSSPIKRLKEALSAALEYDVPTLPSLPLMTPHTPVATSSTPESEIERHQDTHTMVSDGSGPVPNAGGLLSDTHVHWLTTIDPITSADRFEIFATPPDSSLDRPPIPNDPIEPADPAAEPDLKNLSHEELCAYVKSLIGHSNDLVNVIKAQRIQIGLDDMAINRFQQQVHRKEQRGKSQGSLTTMATIATESAFIEMVKERENAANAKRARREATQKATARKKTLKDLKAALHNAQEDLSGDNSFDLRQIQAELQELGVDTALATKPTEQRMTRSRRKGKSVNRPPGELSVVPVDALRTRRAAAHKNYCEDSDADYVP